MKTKDLFKDKLKRREVLRKGMGALGIAGLAGSSLCLLYTSDAADE